MMKIDLNTIDIENFIIKDGEFMGEPAKLVIPMHQGAKWTQENKIFRSSIWSEDGELLSAGFPKFTNFGEKPKHFPVPTSLDGAQIIDKMDGSLCMMDYDCITQSISMRTRGTFTYKTLDNSSDFEYCLNKYPKIKEWLQMNCNVTLLFEITTPNLKIVLDYGNEPDLTLIGGIYKDSGYLLMHQDKLDTLSKIIGVKRPKRYEADSLEQLIKNMKALSGAEGCCLYTDRGQTIHKIKSEEYLKLHYLKTELNDNKLLDLLESLDFPQVDPFEKYIVDNYDWECFNHIRHRAVNMIIKTIIARDDIDVAIHSFNNTCMLRKIDMSSRASVAKLIMSEFKEYSAMLFMYIDGKFCHTNDRVKKFIKSKVKEELKK